VAQLATAGGTLVLAIATFASVRSANRAARTAERALQAGLRPVLVPSRIGDPDQKITWQDERLTRVGGGRASVEVENDVIYLVLSLRNAGAGVAVLDAWDPSPTWHELTAGHGEIDTFRRLTRDLYIPAGDIGLWQGALRDPAEPAFATIRDAIAQRNRVSIDLLYSDHEGGQRTISRFACVPAGDDVWLAQHSRHWNIDRDDPR
jgi:hypothetical protein